MTPQPPHRWAEADRIFHNALAYSPDKRPGYIRDACGSDAELAHEVHSLLAYHERADAMVPREPWPIDPSRDPIDASEVIDPLDTPWDAPADRPLDVALVDERADTAVRDSAPTAADQPLPTAPSPRRGLFTALWWWQTHQLVVSLAYGMAVYLVWLVWQSSGQPLDRWTYIAALGAALLASTLRMHLWFSSRWYLEEWRHLRRQVWPWLRLSDGAFGVLLLAAGAAHRFDQPRQATLLVGAAVIVLLTFLLVEPATIRAADSELG